MKEAKTQATVNVGIDSLWKCLSKDLHSILPQVTPNFVQNAEVIEGDGSLGSVILFTFGPGESHLFSCTPKWKNSRMSMLDGSQSR